MKDDRHVQEFADIFRCTPEMAPVYIARIHERIGHEVPMDSILAAMRKIAPKRLSMDTIVERLKKTQQAPARSRANHSGDAAAHAGGRAPSHAARAIANGTKPSALQQISRILTVNWERGRRLGLKPPVMSTDRFIRTTQSIAGTPTPSVARILRSVEKLERRDILITPNLVADDINESDET
jgi:hypothetical protein